jgi:NAD(P)-dependent dehydrogenase (short-subunit alcohol dehydrogenase family)
MKRLQNKTAIITGAAGGMGKEEALLFAKEGANVLATDLQEAKLSQWVQEARQSGLNIHWMKHDVASSSDWTQVFQYAVSLFGKVNVLINNAGVFPPGKTTENTSENEWEHLIRINLTGPFLGCKTALPYFIQANGGSIVNVASIAGIVGGNGPAYSASKGGLRLLTKDLAVEFAKHNIRVNVLDPGGVLTPMTENIVKVPGMDEMIKSMSPQGRMAQPIELAYGALFLASDESSFMTGADLVMDGGAVIR